LKNYCSLGDTKYLPHLICLIESIKRHIKGEHNIHILALDENVKNKLKNKFQDIKIYDINEVQKDFEIRSLRFLPPGNEAISNAKASNKDPGFVQFCWAMASCFCNWLMERINQSITYVDADILFFSDMDDFFSELGKKSIGFVSHRIPYLYTSGEFNVGIVHFSCDGPGKSALKKWKLLMSNPQNNYSMGFGTCGDQKYLEVLYSIYRDDTCIVDQKFGHLAPWNVTNHSYDDNKIIWNNEKQKLTYFHFAHFVMNEDGTYKASYNNEWIWGDPLKVHSFVNSLYEEYNQKMRKAIMETT